MTGASIALGDGPKPIWEHPEHTWSPRRKLRYLQSQTGKLTEELVREPT